jgi:hypothetical protein
VKYSRISITLWLRKNAFGFDYILAPPSRVLISHRDIFGSFTSQHHAVYSETQIGSHNK